MKETVTLGLLLDDAQNREHILLLGQRIAFVDLTVEVNSQMRYGHDRTIDAQQPCFRIKGVVAAQQHAPGNRQRAVKPRV